MIKPFSKTPVSAGIYVICGVIIAALVAIAIFFAVRKRIRRID